MCHFPNEIKKKAALILSYNIKIQNTRFFLIHFVVFEIKKVRINALEVKCFWYFYFISLDVRGVNFWAFLSCCIQTIIEILIPLLVQVRLSRRDFPVPFNFIISLKIFETINLSQTFSYSKLDKRNNERFSIINCLISLGIKNFEKKNLGTSSVW